MSDPLTLVVDDLHALQERRRFDEVDDLILGYNATGRLCRVIMLDPRRLLSPDTTTADAIDRVTEKLLRLGAVRQSDLDVLRSALDRADVRKVS